MKAKPVGMPFRLSQTQWMLLSIYVSSAVMSCAQGMLIPVLPLLPDAFHITPGLAAQIVTAQAIGRLFALYPSGIIVDRYGRRPALLVGPLLIVFGASLSALAPDYWLLMAAFLVTGVGNALWQISREVSAVDMVQPNQRGRMLSVFFGTSSVGIAVGPLIGSMVTEAFGFRAVFWIYAALAVFTFLVSLTIKETAKETATYRPVMRALFEIGGLKEIEPHLRATYIVVVFGTFTATMRMTLRQSILPLLMVIQLGLGTANVGTVFALIGIVEFLMVAPTGIFSDKLGRKAVVVPSAVLALIAFTLYPFGITFFDLAAISILGAIATGLAMGSMTTYTYDVVPAHARGRLQTLRRSIADIGGILGPVVGGYILDTYRPSVAFLCFVPLQLAATLLLIFVAKETLRRDSPGVQEPV